ncbi:MAG TPA: hypothetical protein VI653_25700 [Steroidobacteraceae bacterium]
MHDNPTITFVCCVESGPLEAQTVRMVESVRMFGGRFASAPIVAVTPRPGPRISTATRAMFRRHEVEHMRLPGCRKYNWFNFFNKPLALVAAEAHTHTEFVGFLDSDLLIVREPELLEPRTGEDLTAFPVEIKEMGTTGPGDPYEEFWKASCQVVGIELEALPWITTAQSKERVRLYFNSGIFAYRRGTGFGAEYLRVCRALLDSRVGTNAPGYGLGFKEQVSVGFAAATLGLNWRALPYSHNYPLSSITPYDPALLAGARVVHYHDAMWPPFWSTFLQRIRETQPHTAAWLTALGPMKNDAPLLSRFLAKALRAARTRQAERYRAACTAC